MKNLLHRLESEHAGIKSSLLRALSNIRTGHLLDRRFLAGLSATSPDRPESKEANRSEA